jgi:hypothetical protein
MVGTADGQRPDVKVDDDSFVMLAELEVCLCIMLHENRTEQLCEKHWDYNDLTAMLSADSDSSLPGPELVMPLSSDVE